MILTISQQEFVNLLKFQLSNFFFIDKKEANIIDAHIEVTLQKCESCFSQNKNKYFNSDGQVYFNPYHSVQYMTFLYFLSNVIYCNENGSLLLCDKIYYLNKMLNGVDILYAVELPDFFMAEHPIGSVMGRAKYNNGFMFFQNCTVGGVERLGFSEVYPILGNNVHLYANSSIIGECLIGNNVNVGAGTLIKNQNVPDNSNVFGQSPNLIIKPKEILL